MEVGLVCSRPKVNLSRTTPASRFVARRASVALLNINHMTVKP